MQGECPSIVVIDIGNAKRWQCVCQLTRVRHAELIALLDDIIHHDQDHVMPIDIGDADQAAPRVVSLGKTYGLFFFADAARALE